MPLKQIHEAKRQSRGDSELTTHTETLISSFRRSQGNPPPFSCIDLTPYLVPSGLRVRG